MNRAEKKSKKQAKSEGWHILTIGKPDKILFRYSSLGKIQIRFREDKGIGDRLNFEQKIYLTLLKKAGLAAEVWYEWGSKGYTKEWIIGKDEEADLEKYIQDN